MKLRPAGAVLLALALSGCGMFGKSERPPPCPKVFLANEISTLTRFRPGGGRDLTDVAFQVDLTGYSGSCTYDKNKLTVTLDVNFAVARGPAGGPTADFEYFVAIPKMYPADAAKRQFDVAFRFPPGAGRGQFQDEVEIDVPLSNRTTGPSNEIYIGLQLTPDELDYNRKQQK
jgi:hypothetical protein